MGIAKIALLALAMIFAQGHAEPAQQAARVKINDLVRSFTAEMERSGDPTSYLSPAVTGQERANEIAEARKHYTGFEIKGFRVDRDLDFRDANHASLSAWIHWETAQTEVEQEATLHFVQFGGRWYFRDFDFLVFPQKLVSEIILLSLLYAAIVIGFEYHWRWHKSGSVRHRMAWDLLLLTPVGWFLYPKHRPWKPSQRGTEAIPVMRDEDAGRKSGTESRLTDYIQIAALAVAFLGGALAFTGPGNLQKTVVPAFMLVAGAWCAILMAAYRAFQSFRQRRKGKST